VKEWYYDYRNLYTTLNMADLVSFFNVFQIVRLYASRIENIGEGDQVLQADQVKDIVQFTQMNQRRVLKKEDQEEINQFICNYKTVYENEKAPGSSSLRQIHSSKLLRIYENAKRNREGIYYSRGQTHDELLKGYTHFGAAYLSGPTPGKALGKPKYSKPSNPKSPSSHQAFETRIQRVARQYQQEQAEMRK
jgi:hypothetical protein